MADKQANLAKNFPKFIDVLRTIPGGLPNLHIGVTTSDLGTSAAGDAMAGSAIGTPMMGGCSGKGKAGILQTYGAPIAGDVFISDISDPTSTTGARIRNYTGDLATVFGTMATGAGAEGCGFEQHLEAVKQALQPSNAINQKFIRKADPATGQPEAYLGVILIADEDDCSLEHSSLLTGSSTTLGPQQSFRCTRFGVTCDQNGKTPDDMNKVGAKGACHPNDNSAYLTKVSDYVTFLQNLKADPKKVIVAGIVGDPTPVATELRAPEGQTAQIPALFHSCSYVGADHLTEVGDPAVRIKFFLDQFPNRNTLVSICQADLTAGLQQVGDLLKTVIGDPCIEGKLADVDPNTAGAQYDCSVSVVTNQDQPSQTEVILPKCDQDGPGATNQPCWHLSTDEANCPKADHFTLKTEGTLGQDAHILANCVTDPGDQ
jgi:hypothetical protein